MPELNLQRFLFNFLIANYILAQQFGNYFFFFTINVDKEQARQIF